MPGRTRPSSVRRRSTLKPKHLQKAKKACLDDCPNGYQRDVRGVSPRDVHMNADDTAWANLHSAGRLLWCAACGCVWERYHDDVGVCLDKKGTFDRYRLPHAFERYIFPC